MPHNISKKHLVIGCVILLGILGGVFSSSGVTHFVLSRIVPNLILEKEFFGCFQNATQTEAINCITVKGGGWIGLFGASPVGHLLDQYRERLGDDFTCHLAGHIIGEDIYDATHDLKEAFTSCTQSCFAGCLHGAAEGHIADKGLPSFLATDFEKLCSDTGNEGTKTICFHGLGHAIMLGFDGNIHQSLDACSALTTSSNYFNFQCYTGAFMELFSAAQGTSHLSVASSTYTKQNDSLYPCTDKIIGKNSAYETACYLQLGPMLWQRALELRISTFALCDSAPFYSLNNCYRGIGLAIAALTPSQSDTIVNACRNAPDNTSRESCLLGAANFLILDPLSGESFRQVCGAVPIDLQPQCDYRTFAGKTTQ